LGITEENDNITVGRKDTPINMKDLNNFFESILSRPWCDGRSYWLNGIFHKSDFKMGEPKWFENCDYFINWDS
jgi:hypothetical protein